ncbi:MAG: PP2C family protein-serine/threonine phosphatase, partial [Candidatus Ozemobacteraceae bacterium]
RDYSSWFKKNTPFLASSENLLEILEEIREDREILVALCREEAAFFRTLVEERVQELLTRIKEQYHHSFFFLGLSFLISLLAVFYLPRVIADPIIAMCEKFEMFEPGKLIPGSATVNIKEIDLLERNFQSLVVRIKIDFDAIKRYISAFGEICKIFSTLYQKESYTLAENLYPGLNDISHLCLTQLPPLNFVRLFFFIEDQKNIFSCAFPSTAFGDSKKWQEFFKPLSLRPHSMAKFPTPASFHELLKSPFLWSFSKKFFPGKSMNLPFPTDWSENLLNGCFCLLPLFHTIGWSQTPIDSINNDGKQVFGVMFVHCDIRDVDWSQEELTFLSLISSQTVSLIETGHLLQKSLQAQRLQFHLDLAKEIQTSALPQQIPILPGLETEAICQMADAVGGDLYDVFLVNTNCLGVIVADISGKSISAALRMMVLKTLIKTFQMSDLSPGQFLTALNKLVCQNFSADSFVTMVYFIIDPGLKRIVLANAGHLPLICYSNSTKNLTEYSHDGFPLGLADCTYGEIEFSFSPGDFLVAFTDGVTECKNPQGDLFGLPALHNLVSRVAGKRFIEKVALALASFRGNSPISDDVTIVAVQMK